MLSQTTCASDRDGSAGCRCVLGPITPLYTICRISGLLTPYHTARSTMLLIRRTKFSYEVQCKCGAGHGSGHISPKVRMLAADRPHSTQSPQVSFLIRFLGPSAAPHFVGCLHQLFPFRCAPAPHTSCLHVLPCSP